MISDLPGMTLHENQITVLHEALQPTLVDLIAFGLVTKQCHWNVVGPHFRGIHLHLDEVHEEIEDLVDRIAERLVTVGGVPQGQANAVAAAEVHEVPGSRIIDHDVIQFLTERLTALVGRIRDRMAKIEDVDTVTADIFHEVVDTLEKQVWMLRVQLAR